MMLCAADKRFYMNLVFWSREETRFFSYCKSPARDASVLYYYRLVHANCVDLDGGAPTTCERFEEVKLFVFNIIFGNKFGVIPFMFNFGS